MLDNPVYHTYFCSLPFYVGNIFSNFIIITFSDKFFIIYLVATSYHIIKCDLGNNFATPYSEASFLCYSHFKGSANTLVALSINVRKGNVKILVSDFFK